MTSRRSLLVISNAAAGSADEQVEAAAVAALREGAQVTVEATSSPEDLAKALAQHPDADAVVVLGGDGSLHAVVQALHDADRLDSVAVGLVPMGTGNDFARGVGLPDDPVAAAEVVLTGSPHALDLGVTADDQVVVNAVHAGVGAEAAAAGAPWKRVLGPLGYAVGSAIAGFSAPGAKVTVTVDDRVVVRDRRVLQVAAGVGRYVGGGAELLPEAQTDDGLLDVTISTATPPLRRLTYALHLRRGEHHDLDDVEYLRGKHVVVEGDATRATNDGELSEPLERHEWTVLPRAWRLLQPQAVTAP